MFVIVCVAIRFIENVRVHSRTLKDRFPLIFKMFEDFIVFSVGHF